MHYIPRAMSVFLLTRKAIRNGVHVFHSSWLLPKAIVVPMPHLRAELAQAIQLHARFSRLVGDEWGQYDIVWSNETDLSYDPL